MQLYYFCHVMLSYVMYLVASCRSNMSLNGDALQNPDPPAPRIFPSCPNLSHWPQFVEHLRTDVTCQLNESCFTIFYGAPGTKYRVLPRFISCDYRLKKVEKCWAMETPEVPQSHPEMPRQRHCSEETTGGSPKAQAIISIQNIYGNHHYFKSLAYDTGLQKDHECGLLRSL